MPHWILYLVIGAVAGWLAGMLIKGAGYGLIGDLILGIVGGWIGGHLLGWLGIHVPAGWGLVGEFVTALIGAVILVALLRSIKRT